MKKFGKLLIVATVFAMCFANVACMGCNDTPVEPDVTDSVPSENTSDMVDENDVSTLTDEETAYYGWKDIEVSDPSFGETGANHSAGTLLERAVTVEKFIQDYPDSQYRKEAVEHYNRLVTAAITGGYTGEEGSSHLYLDENKNTFSADVVTEYDTFLNNYGDTQTAAIVDEYVTLIGNEEGSFTEDIKDFYKNLMNRFEEMFSITSDDMLNDATEGTMNNGNTTNGSNTTGGGADANDSMGTQGTTSSGNSSGQSVQ